MYSITEVLIIQLLCFFIVFNSKTATSFLKKHFPFFNGTFMKKLDEFIEFYKFICENNPLILDYSDKEDVEDNNQKLEDIKDVCNKEELKPEVKFEDKYLERFKKFPNEFNFTEDELSEEKDEYEKIKLAYEKNRLDTINTIQDQLFKINEIQEKGNIDHTKDEYTENINVFGINMMLKFFDIEEEYDEDPDDYDLEELYQDLLKNKEELLKKMDETEKMVMTEEEMRSKARDIIVNKKLDKYVDNYVLDLTPLGNIYMRYNNDKKSFEYFSNSTIPYRYLEPVGRKYVMTYWCKPIFVDIDEELKRAEERYDEEKKKRDDEEKKATRRF